jgi:hypothetical protein
MQTATLKLVPMGAFLLVGAAVAFWRVKMLTAEQIIMARLQGLTGISRQRSRGGRGKADQVVAKPGERAFEIEADTAESFTATFYYREVEEDEVSGQGVAVRGRGP